MHFVISIFQLFCLLLLPLVYLFIISLLWFIFESNQIHKIIFTYIQVVSNSMATGEYFSKLKSRTKKVSRYFMKRQHTQRDFITSSYKI